MSKNDKWAGERLFDVPDNWNWIKLEALTNKINYGYTETATFEKVGPHFLRITDLNEDGVDWESVPFCRIDEKRKDNYLLEKGDVVIARMGSVGKSYLIENPPESVYASYLIRLKLNSMIIPKYLDYFNHSLTYWSQITSKSKGSTRPNVNAGVLKNLNIPLAPLPEQQRIVNQIESLFEKIDKVEILINEAREGFKMRKEAILAKAFRGELTVKWRDDNEVNESVNINSPDEENVLFRIPENWSWVKYEEIANFKNGLAKRKGKDGVETIVLRLADVLEDQFVLHGARSILLTAKEIDAYKVTCGDSLIIRVNGSKDIVGKSVLFSESEDVAFCDHLIRVNYKNSSFTRYIHYLWNSSIVRRQLDELVVSSAGQNTISQGSLKEIMLPIPPDNEMLEIVSIIEHFIEKEKSLTNLTDLSRNVEMVRKTILAKAFRGELGTNRTNEARIVFKSI